MAGQLTIRVMLVDDQEFARRGLGLLLAGQPGIEVVAETGNGAEAVALAGRCRPGIVLTEIPLPGLDGIEMTRDLLRYGDGPRVVIVTSVDSVECLLAALHAGASGFILKNTPISDVITAVRAVAAGGAVICPRMTRHLIGALRSRPTPDPRGRTRLLRTLSEREFEVLGHVSAGRTNREIARSMGLTTATVKSHVSGVLTKLGLRDRVQAALVGYEAGVVFTDGSQAPFREKALYMAEY